MPLTPQHPPSPRAPSPIGLASGLYSRGQDALDSIQLFPRPECSPSGPFRVPLGLRLPTGLMEPWMSRIGSGQGKRVVKETSRWMESAVTT